GESVTRPSDAARKLLGLGLSRDVAWSLLGFSIALTVLVMFGLSGGEPVPLVPALEPLSPLMTFLFLGCSTIILGYGIYFTGNAMQGSGTLTGALLVVGWIQILQIAAIFVQSFLIMLSPGFGTLVGLAISIGLIWVLLSFIDVLHDFGSLGRAALLMLFVIVGIGLGLTLILGLIGVGL
ncbi:MAG: YIP1 family protein, partial [Pseudomonadota bacterium]